MWELASHCIVLFCFVLFLCTATQLTEGNNMHGYVSTEDSCQLQKSNILASPYTKNDHQCLEKYFKSDSVYSTSHSERCKVF